MWNSVTGSTNQAPQEEVDKPLNLLILLHDYEKFPKMSLDFSKREPGKLDFDIEEIKELIRVITIFPSEDSSFERCTRYPFVAVEIITEVYSGIIDRIAAEKTLMDFLFDFLNNERYNTILAGYFSKVVMALIKRYAKSAIEYMSDRGYFVILANNLYIKAFSEIIIKILNITNEEPYFCLMERITLLKCTIAQLENSRGSTVYFLPEILVSLIRAECQVGAVVNSWKSLVSTLLTNFSLDILIASLKSQDTDKSITSLKILAEIIASVHGVPATTSLDQSECFFEDYSKFLLSIAESLPSLVQKLNDPNHALQRTQTKVTIKTVCQPRFIIIDFINICIANGHPYIDKMLVETKALHIIIDLFFEFQYSSMLHGSVHKMISAILTTRLGSDLATDLFSTGIIEKLMGSNEKSLNYGHVIAISNVLAEAGNINEAVRCLLKSVAGWQEYVDTVLRNKNEIMLKVWGQLKLSEEQPKKRDAVAMLNRMIKKTPIVKKANHMSELIGKDDYISGKGSQDFEIGLDNTETKFGGKDSISLLQEILIEHTHTLSNMDSQPATSLISSRFPTQATQNEEYWRFGCN